MLDMDEKRDGNVYVCCFVDNVLRLNLSSEEEEEQEEV